MRKKLLTVFLALGITSLLNANGFDTKVSVGATAAKIGSENYTQFGVGYTSNTVLDNDIILGFGNSLSYGNVRSGVDVTTLDMDLRAGYELIQNLRAYAIVTGAYQYLDDSSAFGLGYGPSLEYRLSDNIAVEGTYKTTKMRYSTQDYDYKTSNIAVKFNF